MFEGILKAVLVKKQRLEWLERPTLSRIFQQENLEELYREKNTTRQKTYKVKKKKKKNEKKKKENKKKMEKEVKCKADVSFQ